MKNIEKIKTNKNLFLILGLLIISCLLITNRFIVNVPDWLAIILIIPALVLVWLNMFLRCKSTNKKFNNCKLDK